MTPAIRIRRLSDRATIPEYRSAGASGMDVCACLVAGIDSITIHPLEIVRVPLGFAMAIPEGFEAQIRPRSGLSSTYGITVVNAPGTIDSDYRGEVQVPLINLSRDVFEVTQGMRIAQMVIAPVARVAIEEAPALDDTARGAGGFGSTGR